MPIVRLKDKGVTLKFPDGMSQQDIASAIDAEFYQTATSGMMGAENKMQSMVDRIVNDPDITSLVGITAEAEHPEELDVEANRAKYPVLGAAAKTIEDVAGASVGAAKDLSHLLTSPHRAIPEATTALATGAVGFADMVKSRIEETLRQAALSNPPDAGEAVAAGGQAVADVPPAVAQRAPMGPAAMGGMLSNILGQVAGQFDAEAIKQKGEEAAARTHFEPTDPGAQALVGIVSSVPVGTREFFAQLAGWADEHPNVAAALLTTGDLAELKAYGKVFHEMGRGLKRQSPVGAQKPTRAEPTTADTPESAEAIRRAEPNLRERLNKQPGAQKAAEQRIVDSLNQAAAEGKIKLKQPLALPPGQGFELPTETPYLPVRSTALRLGRGQEKTPDEVVLTDPEVIEHGAPPRQIEGPAELLALPPGQGFTIAGEHVRFSPEQAAKVKELLGVPALPGGQGFEMVGKAKAGKKAPSGADIRRQRNYERTAEEQRKWAEEKGVDRKSMPTFGMLAGRKQPQRAKTLSGRIMQLGGIRGDQFENMFKDRMPTEQKLSRRFGKTLDALEGTLKEEGFLLPSENLREAVQNKDRLGMGHPSEDAKLKEPWEKPVEEPAGALEMTEEEAALDGLMDFFDEKAAEAKTAKPAPVPEKTDVALEGEGAAAELPPVEEYAQFNKGDRTYEKRGGDWYTDGEKITDEKSLSHISELPLSDDPFSVQRRWRPEGDAQLVPEKTEVTHGPKPQKNPLGSEAYIQAKKQPDGRYKLFYRGTKNEIFPGELFRTPKEARDYFKVQKAKEAESASDKADVQLRKLSDIAADINTAIGERGSVTGERTEAQDQAIRRLADDIKKFEAKAGIAGKKLEQYLIENEGWDPANAKMLAEAEAEIRMSAAGIKPPEEKKPDTIEQQAKKIEDLERELGLEPKAQRWQKDVREEIDALPLERIIESDDLAMVKEVRELELAAERAAKKAYETGEKYASLEAKRKHLLAAGRLKARKALRAEIKQMHTDLKKVKKRVPKMSVEAQEDIKNLLDGLNLQNRQKRTVLKLQRTRDYLTDNPEAEIPKSRLDRLKELDRKQIKDLTIDELRDVHNAVMHRAHIEATKQRLKVGRQKKDLINAVGQAIGEMRPYKDIKEKAVSTMPGLFSGVRKKGRQIKNIFGIHQLHFDLLTEGLAGPDSVMHQVLHVMPKEGKTVEIKYRQDAFDQFKADMVEAGLISTGKGKTKKKGIIPKDDLNDWISKEVDFGKVRIDGRVKSVKLKVSRGERMALYAHSLNPDNKAAILQGGFGLRSTNHPNRVYRIDETDLKDIIADMGKGEKEFVEGPMANLFDAQGKAMGEVFYEKNMYPLQLVEHYFPKDVMASRRGSDVEFEDALDRFKGRWIRPGVSKGMLEKRVGSIKPIYLNPIGLEINRSVNKAAAYVGLEIPLSNASRFLYNEKFRSEMKDRYGDEVYREIEQALRDMAGEHKTFSDLDSLMMGAKNNIAVAILGANPFVMAKQTLSLPIYGSYVDYSHLAAGLTDYIAHPRKLKETHIRWSPEFRERVEGGYSRDVQDVFKQAQQRRLLGGKKGFQEKMMSGIQFHDEMAVIPGMQGAVLQALAEFKQGKQSKWVKRATGFDDAEIAELTPEQKIQAAYKFADYVTERTQPMFSPEHRSGMSRGTTMEKMLTMFTSFTNQGFNLMTRSIQEAQRTGAPKDWAKVGHVAVLLGVINTAGVMGIDELRDMLYQRSKDKDWKDYAFSAAKNWAGYVYILRDMVNMAEVTSSGKWRARDFDLPVFEIPNTLARLGVETANALDPALSEKKRKKHALNAVDDLARLGSLGFGVPYATPKKIVESTVFREKKRKYRY